MLDHVHVFLWAWRSLRSTTDQLDRRHARDVVVSGPPACSADDRALRLAIRLRQDKCLSRALVRQAWHAAQGDRRDVIIGVTAPSSGFTAHAWLEGDDDGERRGFVPLHRLTCR